MIAALVLAVSIPAPTVPTDRPAAVEVESALLKVKGQETMLEAPAGVYLNALAREDIEDQITAFMKRAVAAETDAAVLREALLKREPPVGDLRPWVLSFALGLALGAGGTLYLMSR